MIRMEAEVTNPKGSGPGWRRPVGGRHISEADGVFKVSQQPMATDIKLKVRSQSIQSQIYSEKCEGISGHLVV